MNMTQPRNLTDIFRTLRNTYCCSCNYQYSEDGTIDTSHCLLEDTENLPCVLLRVFDIIFNEEARIEATDYE
jgi:hypothetical protein